MTLLARSAGVVLLDAGAATGEWKIWPGGIAFWDAWGTWATRTATLQHSPDDGTTAISYTPVLTADGSVDSIVIPAGRKVRIAITGSGSTPSITSTLTRQE